MITNFFIISSIVFIAGCSKKAVELQGEVAFLTGILKINSTDATIGSRIKKDDILLTGNMSQATIQVSETAVIIMQSDSEIKFDSLANEQGKPQNISMELSRGTTFHKVLKSGTEYTVKAPTAVASVRGTSFEVSGDSNKTRVSVVTGRVSVKKNPGMEEIILTAGESIEVKADTDVSRRISDKAPAVNRINTVAGKTVTEKTDKALPPQVKKTPASIKQDKVKTSFAAKTESRETLPDPAAVKALMNKKDPDIKDIKKVYSRIDSIHLYSGEIITGAIIGRGDTYSVMTTGGIVKIAKKDIQSDRIIR